MSVSVSMIVVSLGCLYGVDRCSVLVDVCMGNIFDIEFGVLRTV